MKKIALFKFALPIILSLWTISVKTQENETKGSVNQIKHRKVDVFTYNDVINIDKLQTVKLEGINLAPYQPSGWDDKIVVTTASGTNTSSSTIYNNQTIYVDLAIANFGTTNVTQSYTSKLYIDGMLSRTITGTDLNSESYKTVADIDIGALSTGSHILKYVVDVNNDISETEENDNEYSRTINITTDNSTICANLVPYQRDGWDDKIVLSTVMGTNTSAAVFYDNQIIYVDWAAINNGTCDISESFSTKVYVDNVEVSVLEIQELGADYSLSKPDIAIGPLTPGMHTIKLDCDANSNVSETNESDNEYSRSISVITQNCANVNITPDQPAGWDDKIVLSTVTETNISASAFFDNQNIYLDWALINNGTCDISGSFSVKIYVDGVLENTTELEDLNSNSSINTIDINVGTLNAGTHTFKIVVDANNDLIETNENDNEYTRIITVAGSVCINISPYQPLDWDDRIVVSTVTETNISASTIYDNQDIYLDLAFVNNGTCDVSDTVYTKVYVDDILRITYYTPTIQSEYYIYINDLYIGTLLPGTHTCRVVTDAESDVIEFNESDNEYMRTFTVAASITGFESLENSLAVKIYPNPVSNELVIEFKGNKERINFGIYNSAGQLIYNGELFEIITVQTTNFIPGYYLLKFYNGKISGTKMIIKK